MPGPNPPPEVSESELSPKPGAARRPEIDTPSVRAFWHFGVVPLSRAYSGASSSPMTALMRSMPTAPARNTRGTSVVRSITVDATPIGD